MNQKIFKISKQIGLIGLLASTTFATNARIESMGKSSRFIMDDISIYDNAANIGIYPNFLIGDLGAYNKNTKVGENLDPQAPWFGGIFSLGLGEGANKDPRISIGGALNRVDAWHSYLPDFVQVNDGVNSPIQVAVPRTVTNFDGFLGFSTSAGNLFGSHIYIAMQDGANFDSTNNRIVGDPRAFASIVKADLGFNIQLNEDLDWEMSAGIGRIAFGPQSREFWSPSEWSFFGRGRMFSTVSAINGEFVPQGSMHFIQTDGRKNTNWNFGPGVNVALDRGFFWMGLEGFYNKDEVRNYVVDNGKVTYEDFIALGEENKSTTDVNEQIGTQISFGIERNIWFDWLVVRVGGKKTIAYNQTNASLKSQELENSRIDTKRGLYGNTNNYWATNPIGDGSANDHIGFGFGINVEEKLKIDVTVAEDVLYRNPFQGGGRLLSRISSTYSF